MSAGFDLTLALCNVCRRERAILVWEPQERWAEPLCAGCADDRIETEQATTISVDARAALALARSEPVRRPAAVTGVPWTPDLERELRAYRLRLLRSLERASGEERCVALVAAGDGRCVRRATEKWGLCETHSLNGCRLPGLGWKDGSPVGRIISRPGRSRVT